MLIKELTFEADARQRLKEGISKIARAVGSTLGPLGNTVIIEDTNTTRGVKITKDGVTVAKSIVLDDPVENMAVTIVREAAERTATSAGDGTTTSIILAEALIDYGLKAIERDKNLNVTKMIRKIREIVDRICDDLEAMAIPVNDDNIKHIATISANNDPELGGMIADVYSAVGKDGVVKPAKSKTDSTYHEVINGIKFDRGYSSPLFSNTERTKECIFENANILITDVTIDSLHNIEQNILAPCIRDQKPLLIIGTVSQDVLNMLVANKIKNGFKFCVVEPPSHGWKREELMEDLAHATGGAFLRQSVGDDLTRATMVDLGFATKVVVSSISTLIVPEADVSERVNELKDAYEQSEKADEKSFLKERISMLNGAIGIIYAGGESEIEKKELYDRVEDAVLAVEAAIDKGILPGGGLALYAMGDRYGDLSDVLQAPLVRIASNGGYTLGDLSASGLVIDAGNMIGIDFSEMECGNMIDMGIIDPAKVTINALRNATSVATTILGTDAVINTARE